MKFTKDSRGRIRFTENGIRYELTRLKNGEIKINHYVRSYANGAHFEIKDDYGFNLSPEAAGKLNAALAAI